MYLIGLLCLTMGKTTVISDAPCQIMSIRKSEEEYKSFICSSLLQLQGIQGPIRYFMSFFIFLILILVNCINLLIICIFLFFYFPFSLLFLFLLHMVFTYLSCERSCTVISVSRKFMMSFEHSYTGF